MTDQVVVETSRVNQEWPAALKLAVQEKVGKRRLTEFTVMAVQRQLDDGGADLAVEARDARDLAQRVLNVLATVVDHEARLTFLAGLPLPEWVNTTIWPDDVLARVNADVDPSVTEEPMPEGTQVQIQQADETPELAKVGQVTTTRVEPKRGEEALGTADEPVIIPESVVNDMSGVEYSGYQHIHSPAAKCLKNVFITADAEGLKHCPYLHVGRSPVEPPAIPQEKVDELADGPSSPVAHQASDANLFERLKQSGALKTASQIPVPEKPPVEEAPTPLAPAPLAGPPGEAGEQAPLAASSAGLPTAEEVERIPGALDDIDGDLEEQEAIAASLHGYGKQEQTSGPGSGPLPEVPDSSYAPDAVPLAPATCPNCRTALEDGLCWTCGYEVAS